MVYTIAETRLWALLDCGDYRNVDINAKYECEQYRKVESVLVASQVEQNWTVGIIGSGFPQARLGTAKPVGTIGSDSPKPNCEPQNPCYTATESSGPSRNVCPIEKWRRSECEHYEKI